jgi:PKD repeat protein
LVNTSTNATTYLWSVSGGTILDNSAVNPSIQFSNSGTYTVQLIATSSAGSNTYSQAITVQVDQPAVASFTANSTNVTLPNGTVYFTNTSSNSTGYSWNFDDGFASTDQHPFHQFNEVGTYMVTMTASNSGVCQSTNYSLEITVNANPASILEELNKPLYWYTENEQLVIQGDLIEFEQGSLEVIDLQGKKLLNTEIDLKGTSSIEIETKTWSKGMYIIRLNKGMRFQQLKIMI